MPRDVELAEALAQALNAQYTGKIKKVEFTYDSYIELDNLPNEPVVWITLDTFVTVREGRGVVRRDGSLTLTMITEAGPTDNKQWIDDYIDAFDQLVDLIFKTRVKGQLPIDMESDARYDVDRFHTHRRLVMDAILNYRNL